MQHAASLLGSYHTAAKTCLYLCVTQSYYAGYFLTKIFHPNVSKTGEICVNVLKRDWKSDLGLRHVLVIIRCFWHSSYLFLKSDVTVHQIITERTVKTAFQC